MCSRKEIKYYSWKLWDQPCHCSGLSFTMKTNTVLFSCLPAGRGWGGRQKGRGKFFSSKRKKVNYFGKPKDLAIRRILFSAQWLEKSAGKQQLLQTVESWRWTRGKCIPLPLQKHVFAEDEVNNATYLAVPTVKFWHRIYKSLCWVNQFFRYSQSADVLKAGTAWLISTRCFWHLCGTQCASLGFIHLS